MILVSNNFLITDMGVFHLLTTDERWIEICHAKSAMDFDQLRLFTNRDDADAFVAEFLQRGIHVQVIAENDVPWDKPPLDDTNSCIDWAAVKDIVQSVLERAASGSESSFREHAESIGVTYEDYLAAAITHLISENIEEQLGD